MIGLFDSGVGGLTVLKAMRERFPSIDVVYFGDTKHAPYGSRPREELAELTAAGIRFLLDQGASAIVSACNSASVALAVSFYDVFSLPPGRLVEMAGPTVSAFKGSTGRIALCATQATVDSGVYQSAFRMIGLAIEVFAIPELAGAIESGQPERVVDAIIANALERANASSFDTLILGCTHYPLALAAFRKALGENTKIFDPAGAVAERVEALFWPREVGIGSTKFFLSKDSAVFRRITAQLFPESEYSVTVVE